MAERVPGRRRNPKRYLVTFPLEREGGQIADCVSVPMTQDEAYREMLRHRREGHEAIVVMAKELEWLPAK